MYLDILQYFNSVIINELFISYTNNFNKTMLTIKIVQTNTQAFRHDYIFEVQIDKIVDQANRSNKYHFISRLVKERQNHNL